MWRCNAPGGFGPGGMHHHMGWRNPDMIAKRLNAMETEIGIRANQLDAWRDFTDALQGMMQRPLRPGKRLTAAKATMESRSPLRSSKVSPTTPLPAARAPRRC